MSKTFYTSNYTKSGTLAEAVAISFAADIPAFYTGAKDADLAPTDELLTAYHDRKINHDEYAEQYIALLASRGLTPASVAERFDDGTIFVCYDYEDGTADDDETDNGDLSICHRVFLAKWLNSSGEAIVNEI